jgi:predicted dehydrogenase
MWRTIELARVGLIGVGRFGKNHKRILQEMGELAATCDIAPGEDYSNYHDMIAEHPEIDHVVICTPAHTHYAIVNDCLRYGKHVFCEKPLTGFLESTEDLIELAINLNLKLQVGFIQRFNPIIQKLQQEKFDFIHLHKNPTFTIFERCGPKPEHIAGPNILDTAIHDIDLALWFYGKYPSKIGGIVGEDYTHLELDFGDLGMCSVHSIWGDEPRRTINGIDTTTNKNNALKDELESFIKHYRTSLNTIEVMKVIKEAMRVG